MVTSGVSARFCTASCQLAPPHAEDGAFGSVDQGRKAPPSQRADIGNGEGAALHFFQRRLAIARSLGHGW
jgi:hypothetical protein